MGQRPPSPLRPRHGANGAPAPERITDAIYARTLDIREYRLTAHPTSNSVASGSQVDGMAVEVFDPVADYLELMRSLFGFEALRMLFRSGLRLAFDAMCVCGVVPGAWLPDAAVALALS